MDEQHAIHAPREVSALVNWLLGSRIEDVVRAFSLRSYAPGLAFRLVFRLTPRGIPRWISHARTQDDLFAAPGDPALVAQIREVRLLFFTNPIRSISRSVWQCLDTGTELPPAAPVSNVGPNDTSIVEGADMLVLSVGAALRARLEALPEPLMPAALHVRCAEAQDREAAFAVRRAPLSWRAACSAPARLEARDTKLRFWRALQVLASLPPATINAWLAVTACLHLYCIGDRAHARDKEMGQETDAPAEEKVGKDWPWESDEQRMTRAQRIGACGPLAFVMRLVGQRWLSFCRSLSRRPDIQRRYGRPCCCATTRTRPRRCRCSTSGGLWCCLSTRAAEAARHVWTPNISTALRMR
jgi:hypothetical protein